eukprot:3126734-Pyramimonas_sp.AAC.1
MMRRRRRRRRRTRRRTTRGRRRIRMGHAIGQCRTRTVPPLLGLIWGRHASVGEPSEKSLKGLG